MKPRIAPRLRLGLPAAWFGLAISMAVPACAAGHYPVTVHSCNRAVRFDRAPAHAVSNDVNLTEMMLALGLRERMAGYTGVGGWKTATPALRAQLAGLPELARQYPALETLVAAGADFYLAGWNYGMRVGGPVTPESLARFGIASYELTESCSQVMPRPAASFDDVYADLRNLGAIFDVAPRAERQIALMRARLDAVARALGPRVAPMRTFVYDSGGDKPFTAGRLAMPTALIRAAGGVNVMDDLAQSWAAVSWESVVARNPQVIVIVDYGAETAEQKIRYLTGNPALATIDAIRARRFVVIPYDEATPGVRNAEAVEALARALHPAAFAARPDRAR
ncbi:ABC transporter substrate-binding protein [Burkholderia glumae]|uniref:ABC transporter substrate-binding protein n=1 Tax=Burkholderia glumae TaxID=337 RepID=UPI000C276D7F|nr:iron ABC transporter substrate-binding protein [Burkholderia glumae AU6208]QHE12768.1 ABC transporter substrate-binding protein [Burkholderia glumae AU6208]